MSLFSDMTCATVPAVTRRIDHDDPSLTAHKMPMALADEAFSDMMDSTEAMMLAVARHEGQAVVQHHRQQAQARFEVYLDLMAEAGHHAGQLKP